MKKVIENTVEEKLLVLHTAYIGKVLNCSGNTADIQPLMMTKQYGQPAQKLSPVKNAPVIQSAQNKIGTKEITYDSSGTTKTETIITLTPLAEGDLVFCVCAERDISEAKNGQMSTPPIGHHSLSDTVVVGIL